MIRLRDAEKEAGETRRVMFFCPGCNCGHWISTPRWEFNGDMENPTFSPSVLVWWEQGEAHEKKRCHSYVKGGKIRFLADSTHALAGQEVELPEF